MNLPAGLVGYCQSPLRDGLDGGLLCSPQGLAPGSQGQPRASQAVEPGDICLFLKARGLQA